LNLCLPQISGEFGWQTLCNRGNLEANCDKEEPGFAGLVKDH
jgi:hypothetical protein